MGDEPEETALLVRCPAAEAAVGPSRARLDPAAAVGVPAHVTVTYPFRPLPGLADADHDRLDRLFAAHQPFTLVGERTAWFGDGALYVALTGAARVSELIDAVTLAFPGHPPYGGAIAEVVPHVTVGQGSDLAALLAAEVDVAPALPFREHVTAVELWAGPPPASGRGTWRRVRTYPLG